MCCAHRQLGISLHELKQFLPLYDGVTGQPVPEDLDKRIERVRDALMDDARERVDTLGEAMTEGESLQQALDRAFAARFASSGQTGLPEAEAATPSAADQEAGAADESKTGENGLPETASAPAVHQAARADSNADQNGSPAANGQPAQEAVGLDKATAEGDADPNGPVPMEQDTAAAADNNAHQGAPAPAQQEHVAAINSAEQNAPADTQQETAPVASVADETGNMQTVPSGLPFQGTSNAAAKAQDEPVAAGDATTLDDSKAPLVDNDQAAAAVKEDTSMDVDAANGVLDVATTSIHTQAATAGAEPSAAEGKSDAEQNREAAHPVPDGSSHIPQKENIIAASAIEPSQEAIQEGLDSLQQGSDALAKAEERKEAADPMDVEPQQASKEETAPGAEEDNGSVSPEEPEEEPFPSSLDELEQRLLDWHWSNLEYGCSARLDQVDLLIWHIPFSAPTVLQTAI